MDIRPATRRDFRDGACLQGYTNLTYDELVELFGEPNKSDGHDKVYHEWKVVIEGVPVSIYDYKENGVKVKNYNWHIGGFGRAAVMVVKELLEYASRDAQAWGAR